jgi:hypothetical protein
MRIGRELTKTSAFTLLVWSGREGRSSGLILLAAKHFGAAASARMKPLPARRERGTEPDISSLAELSLGLKMPSRQIWSLA